MIYIILLITFILRIVVINQSLWLDEAIGAIAVKKFSYIRILTDFIKSDNHPPLYYLILKAWTDVFGFSEVSIRLPSVLFGVGSVLFTFLIAKKINLKFPETPAMFLAFSQFHIYYSQEARMYSAACFFSTIAIYFFIRILDQRNSNLKNWILFSLAITTLIFTDYAPIFLLPIFWIIVFKKKKDIKFWKNFVFAHIPIFILGFFWIPTFFYQVGRGSWLIQTLPKWKTVAGGANLKQLVLVWMKFVFGRITLANKLLYYSSVLLASFPVLVSLVNSFKKRNKNTFTIWMWFVIPIVLGFLTSFIFPAFIYFRFLYVVPAFYLLIAWGIENFRDSKIKTLLTLAVLIPNILSWFIYISDASQQREQWREAVRFVEGNIKKGEVVIFEFPEPFAPYIWYSKRLNQAQGVTNSIKSDFLKTQKITSETIEDKSGIYHFEYLKELSDEDDVVQKTLTSSGFRISKIYNYQGVGFIYYWIK